MVARDRPLFEPSFANNANSIPRAARAAAGFVIFPLAPAQRRAEGERASFLAVGGVSSQTARSLSRRGCGGNRKSISRGSAR